MAKNNSRKTQKQRAGRRTTKNSDGKYHIKSGVFEQLIGSRAQVMHKTAYKTVGNLTKKHLVKNKRGRIVSRRAQKKAKKANRLVKAGYKTVRGKFGVFSKKNKRGGDDVPVPGAPVKGPMTPAEQMEYEAAADKAKRDLTGDFNRQ
jgi:hypothetical protein